MKEGKAQATSHAKIRAIARDMMPATNRIDSSQGWWSVATLQARMTQATNSGKTARNGF
jgi:hypothetical protein